MSSSSRHRDSAFSIFCLLWAIAALLHIIWDHVLLDPSPFTTVGPLSEIVLALAAAAVVWRPSSVRRLLILATVQVLQVGWQLPYTPDHWLLTGFVNVTILGAAIGLKARGWRSPLRSSDLYQTFTPYVRLEVIIFYGFTFFHKLNADFLDPSSSCAATFLGHITDFFALPSFSALEFLAIVVTLGVEGVLPIGLAIPRLRLWAVLLGAGFHGVLALDVIKMFYNADSVVIISTSDRLLNTHYVETGARMTYFELWSYLVDRPEVRLAYIRAGRYHEVVRAGDSPEFSTGPHPLLRKLLTFRPLGAQAGKICDW